MLLLECYRSTNDMMQGSIDGVVAEEAKWQFHKYPSSFTLLSILILANITPEIMHYNTYFHIIKQREYNISQFSFCNIVFIILVHRFAQHREMLQKQRVSEVLPQWISILLTQRHVSGDRR